MTSKKVVPRKAGTQIVLDPTIPDVEIEIEGERYHLAFDMEALARAKTKLRLAGINDNVLTALDFQAIDVDTLPTLFFAALQRYHPHVTYAHAKALITMPTVAGIFVAIRQAYIASMLPRTPANPRVAALKN